MKIPFVNFWEDKGIPLTWHPKSTTTRWFATDTEDNFKQKENNIFTADSFYYNFNVFGYRIGCADWDLNTNKKRIITLGCSHSVGVGVPYEKSWPYLFSNQLGDVELFNLSVAGGSADTIFRTLYHSIEIIRPDIVAILWPDSTRWELYQSTQWDASGFPCHAPVNKLVLNTDPSLINESHLINLRLKNMELIKLLQRLYKFKLVEVDSEIITAKYIKEHSHMFDPYSFDSRDSVHPGLKMHDYISKIFIDTY